MPGPVPGFFMGYDPSPLRHRRYTSAMSYLVSYLRTAPGCDPVRDAVAVQAGDLEAVIQALLESECVVLEVKRGE